MIVLISLMNGVASFFKGRWTAMASENVARTLREKLYRHMQELPFSYHSRVSTGDWCSAAPRTWTRCGASSAFT